ncbi:helix-turn-helix domain-containing protein [Crossiella sp. SN42]|uniref:PucR family transcriptional regulator n=1 Tax=Crossiella sp. SN42 TaxID=2944808 RepID=UPI00207C3F89|nr:helix-turn-helix domain-containing protein [Crossiella sp. SN42]MCO1582660.1 helix-turn-helix domain-containing protein [Crossiella sp. SN42]
MSRNRVPEPLSVAELVHFGPLAQSQVFAADDLDRQVAAVALVGELDQIHQCEPHAAVVLHGAAALGAWALESALRLAWERNAACLVAPAEITVTTPTAQLAERLRVPLFVVADPAKSALELAAAISDTEAARARLTARCAVLFGERSTARDIIGVINTEVPGVITALVTEDGHVLAGRSAADRSQGSHRVEVAVPGPDGRPWATLVAQLAAWSPSWVETVRTILRLARAPLAATVGRSWLTPVFQAAKDKLLLHTLLTAPDATAERQATDIGWRLAGEHIAVFLKPSERVPGPAEVATPGVVVAWRESFGDLPLIPREDGWLSWWTAVPGGPQEIADRVRAHLAAAALPIPLVAGIGVAGKDLPGLTRSVSESILAAAVASRPGGNPVEQFGDLGPRAVLACLPVDDIAAAARVALAELINAPDAEVLLSALTALLDCAGSTGQAATRLGVHRNTVLGRLERIRARGIDLDSPDQRLALHLACYALLSADTPT